MKCIIHPSQTSSQIAAQSLINECNSLAIQPIIPNLRRVRRALDLLDRHSVRLIDRFGQGSIYEVRSQTRSIAHLVVANGDYQCSCEDARRQPGFTGCKHTIAVRMYESRVADYENYCQWLEERQ